MSDPIPPIGLGTWQNTDPEQCADSVSFALEHGYRHIDTAQAYDNEEYVGDGLARADIERDDYFLATKVWIDKLGHDDVLSSTHESLEKLGVEYVDVLYVHWPSGEYEAEDTMAAFNELYDEGKIRNIGVSNFTPDHLDAAVEASDAPVLANQVEMHPLLQQEEMLEHAEDLGIEVVAYSPLARGEVFDIPEVTEVAEKHNADEAQVSLAWIIEKGAHPIPKATGSDHIRDNFAALELELDYEDIEKIDSIDREERLVDPDFAPDW